MKGGILKMTGRFKWRGPVYQRTTWQHATLIPQRQRRAFLARVARVARPCQYGHPGCSDRDGGACAEIVLALLDRDAT